MNKKHFVISSPVINKETNPCHLPLATALDRLAHAARRTAAWFGLALCLGAAPLAAQAAVITFDDLTCSTAGTSIPNGYKNLNWNNFYCLDGATYNGGNSGYNAGRVSGNNVAYNGFGSPAEYAITTPGGAKFNLNSVYLTGAWNDNLVVTIEAYRNGSLVSNSNHTLSATAPTLVTLNLANIDRVRMSSAGGTPHLAYGADPGFQFVMDNLDIDFGPSATTQPATAVSATGATLNGTVNDNTAGTTARFEYGASTAYGSTIAATPGAIAAGSGDTAVSAALTGLTCNTTYHYRVSARNANDTHSANDQSFTTSACVPDAPTIGAITAGVGRATVAFAPPASDGGASIDQYTVTCEPGGITASGSASPITVTGLTPGQAYTCSVTATSSAGTGPASATASVTPPLPPAAPNAVPTLSQWSLLLLGLLLSASALRQRQRRRG